MQTWLNFANQESSNPHKHEQVDWVDSRVGQSALKFWARESALQLQYRARSHAGVAGGNWRAEPMTGAEAMRHAERIGHAEPIRQAVKKTANPERLTASLH